MIRKFSLIRHFTLAVICAGALSACDSAPGTQDLSRSAPVVQNIQVTPDFLALDLIGDTAGVVATDVTVALDVSDADGDLSKVFIIIGSPIPGGEHVGEAEVAVLTNSRVEVTVSVSIPSGQAGLLAVTAFASDDDGRMSNRIFSSIEVTSGSEPPSIDQIDIPDRVTRPPQGQPPIAVPIVAHVSDPDGIGNVAFVEVLVNGISTLRLCDDGGQGTCNTGFGSSGDVAVGDGLFTLTIQVDALNVAGDNTFEFTAVDRSGLRSNTVIRTITLD
jgi:hypothetical protein